MSTPIQESSAQLSGPDIPGAQINEDGKWVLMVKSAVSINPVFFESCGASINAIMEGWKLVFSKDESWCNELKLLVKTQFQRGIRQSLIQLGWVEGISPEKLSMCLFYRMGSIILHV